MAKGLVKDIGPSLLVMLLIELLAYGIHFYILKSLEFAPTELNLGLAYVLNTLLATGLMIFLLKAPERLQHSLGYLFLLGSGLKFVLYFAVFFPGFKADGDLSKAEFLCFFVPYFLALIVETGSLIRRLNRLQ